MTSVELSVILQVIISLFRTRGKSASEIRVCRHGDYDWRETKWVVRSAVPSAGFPYPNLQVSTDVF